MNPILSKYLFFFPVRYVRREPIIQCLNEVKKIEKLDSKAIEQYQLHKLNQLIHFSRHNIPYYSKAFVKLGNDSTPIRKYEDLMKLPYLTKDIIREKQRLLKSGLGRTSIRSTSGSTGTPLVFSKDRRATAFMDAVMYHTYSWHGIRIGDRQARFWGLPVASKAKIRELLKDFLMNRIRFSAFDLSEKAMENYYRKLLRFRPNYCYGYPSLIYEFACFLEKRGLWLQNMYLKAVIVTGELIVSEQLDMIEKVFGAPIVNEYGCTEVGLIAFQCKQGKLHIMSPNIVVEIIKDGEQVIGEEGEICVTELNAREMPFIRYRLGDRGVLSNESCSCGLNFPVMKVISGRIDSYIITPEGKKVYDAILAYTFKVGIKAFKAVQEQLDLIRVYIVRDSNYSKELEARYLKILKTEVSQKIDWDFIHVDKIEREPSGKLKYFESRLKDNGKQN